ncbi:MAG: hypothetical protein IKJ00_06655 [Clostridia bacterium]|nr:hypothetical protein [Clostridia bacterium]
MIKLLLGIIGCIFLCVPTALLVILVEIYIRKKKSADKPIFLTLGFGLEIVLSIAWTIEFFFVVMAPLISNWFLHDSFPIFWDALTSLAYFIYLVPTLFLPFVPILAGTIAWLVERRNPLLNEQIGGRYKYLFLLAAITILRSSFFLILDDIFLLHFNAQVLA